MLQDKVAARNSVQKIGQQVAKLYKTMHCIVSHVYESVCTSNLLV